MDKLANTLVSTSLITIIAANLGMLLLISWVVCVAIFVRLSSHKEELEQALIEARKKLKEAKKHSPQAQNTVTTETPSPLETLEMEEGEELDDEDSIYLLEALNNMSEDLREKDEQLAILAELHTEQQARLENLQNSDSEESSDDLIAHHQKTESIINKLQHDLTISQRVIAQLESKLRDGKGKDSRIAILEETEKRLRDRVKSLKKHKDQSVLLIEGLRKANSENDKLKRNIKQLTQATQEQLATINKITTELERITRLENHQRNLIEELEVKLQAARSSPGSGQKVYKLERQLEETQATLARTIKEKEFISSHLIEMDKALEKSKETEEALERARKEIETLEMYFPEFASDEPAEKQASDTTTHKPLPIFAVDKEKEPKLFHIVEDNRLFGILQDFWMTLDTPPLRLAAKKNISRPQSLNYWVKTSIHSDEFFVAMGASESLTKALGKAMFEKDIESLSNSDLKDALGELGNVIAGTLANELNPSYIVGISEHLNNKSMEEELNSIAVVTEVLMMAGDEPLYISLAKPNVALN